VSDNSESPVFAFLSKPSMIDYPGCIAAVFFVAGCNFRCGYCHNPELLVRTGKNISWKKLDEICLQFKNEWVDATVITGGEPTLAGNLVDLLKYFQQFNWLIKLDTNGSCPEMLKKCVNFVNYIAMDFKTSISKYYEITACDCGEAISKSIQFIIESDIAYEFRTTVIPCFHDEMTVREMGKSLMGAKKWVLQPFIPRDNLPDITFRDLKRTTREEMEAFRKIASEYVPCIEIRQN